MQYIAADGHRKHKERVFRSIVASIALLNCSFRNKARMHLKAGHFAKKPGLFEKIWLWTVLLLVMFTRNYSLFGRLLYGRVFLWLWRSMRFLEVPMTILILLLQWKIHLIPVSWVSDPDAHMNLIYHAGILLANSSSETFNVSQKLAKAAISLLVMKNSHFQRSWNKWALLTKHTKSTMDDMMV